MASGKPKRPNTASAPFGQGMAKIVLGMIAVGALLCWSAGTWAWPAAWAFTALTAASLGLMALGLFRRNPALFSERQRSPFKPDQPLWDRALIVCLYIAMGLWLVLPGPDVHRLGWSQMPFWLQSPGAMLIPIAIRIMYLALIHNPFLIPNVAVGEETRLASTGPYAWVRHPYYAGFILFYAGAALMLGSWLALIWTAAIALVFMLRLVREEAVLVEKLEGYEDYRRTTRFRLVPWVW